MPELRVAFSQLLSEAAEQLRAAGVPEGRRQALRIWSDLNGTSVGESLITLDLDVEPDRASRFRQAVRRRAGGEPLPYVTGMAGFRHLALYSDRRALIPRPETEGLVDLLLLRVRAGVVADVGTGSGCIALSLAAEGAFDRVLAIDSSAEALELARLNYEASGVPRVVTFVRADLVTSMLPGSLDAIISNPPYLTRNEYEALGPSVRRWEPALALVSGDDGLESTTRLLHEGRTTLRPGGWLAVEVDCTRASRVAQAATQGGWHDVSLHQDLFGRERYLLARRSNTP